MLVPDWGGMGYLWGCGLYSLLSSTRMDSLQPTPHGLSHHRLTVPQPTVPRDERSDHPSRPYGSFLMATGLQSQDT